MSAPSDLPPTLTSLLRCPNTRQTLELADAETLEKIRKLAGEDDLQGAVIRADGLCAFPIREGFPILLADAAISLDSGDS